MVQEQAYTLTVAASDPSAAGSSLIAGQVDRTCTLIVVVGFVAAALGWAPGIAGMLAGLAGGFLSHLAAGVAGYRRVMSSPWPQVRPLDEDDW
jgi:hypothetical protein